MKNPLHDWHYFDAAENRIDPDDAEEMERVTFAELYDGTVLFVRVMKVDPWRWEILRSDYASWLVEGWEELRFWTPDEAAAHIDSMAKLEPQHRKNNRPDLIGQHVYHAQSANLHGTIVLHAVTDSGVWAWVLWDNETQAWPFRPTDLVLRFSGPVV